MDVQAVASAYDLPTKAFYNDEEISYAARAKKTEHPVDVLWNSELDRVMWASLTQSSLSVSSDV